MPETLDMAKTNKPVEAPPPGRQVTTWKCYKDVAKTLRLIGAHLDLNQEGVLDLFREDFENYLATLEAESVAERQRNQK